jgi:OOP family OmpA-OmpF porin
MFKQHQKLFVLAAFATLGASPAFAQGQDIVVDGSGVIPYVIDGRNVVTRSGYQLCWRTQYWSPAAAAAAGVAGCECDADVVPKEQCSPPEPVVESPPPPPPPKPVENRVKLPADVLFDFDKDVLRPEGKARLDELTAQAKQIRLEIILSVGHTDRLGSDAYNLRLSDRRAAAVKAYLVSRGIDSSRIYTEGKGESQPVTGNQCDAVRGRKALISCLQRDRRVDIEVIGTR